MTAGYIDITPVSIQNTHLEYLPVVVSLLRRQRIDKFAVFYLVFEQLRPIVRMNTLFKQVSLLPNGSDL
ncbi:hypothetical protein SDC9_193491 [bioreactor metagenome]|uniref:Uncharacterized protein n=1 Tax=bioreactor metagenome TaxID=1076179 RepID=A0A645I575_9ZZZZ